MSRLGSTTDFYERVPTFRDFSRIADDAWYLALPDDWVVGVADVEQSTKAILENRYKAVNMAGAAVIASVANTLGPRDFPFVFGGDGASFAVSAADAARAQRALSETATWVAEDLRLSLRIGTISVAKIRAEGNDVRVGRYQTSDNVSIAMFSGGGLRLGRCCDDARRDHSSTGCSRLASRSVGPVLPLRTYPSQRGQILTFVVVPAPGASPEDFSFSSERNCRHRGGDPRCRAPSCESNVATEVAAIGL